MNLLEARVVFRDRAAIDVLDLALRFLVRNGKAFAKVALVVIAPAIALAYASARAWGWGAGWAVAVLLAFLARVPFTVLASRVAFEDQVRARDVLADAARALPRIVFARVLWVLAIAVSSTLFLVPALLVAAALVYLDEVLLLERQGTFRSISRAASVAASAYGEALIAVTLLAVVSLTAVGGAELGGRTILGELLQIRPPASALVEGGSVLCLVGWFGAVPYLATARFLSYLNVRTRAEGWDIQTRFATIRARLDASDDEAKEAA